ncbi:hypothetical protein [Sphingobacterium hungaricum]|uniref:Uncharacterized protein n=1 Tax=Sphingobacterium hungaricum TaxID=2082723 RepID=A0A928V124_9SPHI|nr:hypothetical protein [Sphingobacterium hungaricum]MBE8715026.1 hypothetical protein [Sphingobacterium hungaricum]
MKIILATMMLLIAMQLKAQEPDRTQKEEYIVLEIVYDKSSRNYHAIILDKDNLFIKDAYGNIKTFANEAQIFNFMAKDGWLFLAILSNADNQNKKFLMMRTMIRYQNGSSDEKATENENDQVLAWSFSLDYNINNLAFNENQFFNRLSI